MNLEILQARLKNATAVLIPLLEPTIGEPSRDDFLKRDQMVKWCEDNCKAMFLGPMKIHVIVDPDLNMNEGWNFKFTDPAEALLFKLTWA